jgi:large conductance mechanosensitive channel
VLKEFKQFALRGNVIDMAIGIIVGGAFGKIISSLVSDILMPPIGMLVGGIDFGRLFIDLSGRGFATLAEAKAATPPAPTINYGVFLQAVLDFVIVAFCIFATVNQLHRLERKQPGPTPVPETKTCPFCLESIRIQATRCPNCTSELEAA